MNVVERAKAIVLRPDSEWPVIEREPGDPAFLFKNYVAILALIPVIANFIGSSLFGYSLPGGASFRVPIFIGLISAIFAYILNFVVIYLVAMIVDYLAPTFGGRRDFSSALKLTVYSYTPAWLAGIFTVIPALAFLSILGLYGLYLLYIGLPQLMKSPHEKSLLYAGAIVVSALVLAIIVGAIQAALFLRF
jgi:hypothetical protein